MALTKADIAQKIASDCGFMKEEAAEIMEKLLEQSSRQASLARSSELLPNQS